jgi:hypothetical protein
MASATAAVVVCKVGVLVYIVLSAGEGAGVKGDGESSAVIEEDGAETPRTQATSGTRNMSPSRGGRLVMTGRTGSDGRPRRESRDERNVAM